jgi:hypothetical protein
MNPSPKLRCRRRRSTTAPPSTLAILPISAQTLLVEFANLFQRVPEPMVVLELSLNLANLLAAQADVANVSSRIGHGQNRYRVALSLFTRGTSLAMPHHALQ